MRRSTGPSIFRGRAFVNTQSNAQQATSAGLSCSVDDCLPWDTESISIVSLQFSEIFVILVFYLLLSIAVGERNKHCRQQTP